MAEKLTRLKFLINNFSIKAIDKFDKKINYDTINKNNLEENNNNDSLSIKSNNSMKKQNKKKKKQKMTKNVTFKENENKINITNNNSLTR